MSKKTQVIGCRLPVKVYDDFEIKCMEKQIEMSEILRDAVNEFLSTFVLQPNDKLNLQCKGG